MNPVLETAGGSFFHEYATEISEVASSRFPLLLWRRGGRHGTQVHNFGSSSSSFSSSFSAHLTPSMSETLSLTAASTHMGNTLSIDIGNR